MEFVDYCGNITIQTGEEDSVGKQLFVLFIGSFEPNINRSEFVD